MGEPAIRHMTLAEFLRWEDGTDTRYELVRGREATRHLAAVDLRIAMTELYEGLDTDPETAA